MPQEIVVDRARPKQASPLRSWLMNGLNEPGAHPGPHGQAQEKTHSWWRVMCLTGVDYFSTLGYQPAIAALAAGLLSPFATIILILVTLFGALPVYRRVARESHRGEGSIAMLEKLLPWWGGKLVVLVLLGFVATDFMITITLSAADATAHAVENPYAPSWFSGAQVPLTLILIALLAIVFLRGFKEAIGIAGVLVGVYLAANAIVIVVALAHVATDMQVITNWWSALGRQNANPVLAIGLAIIAFPKLALGLSGFETGVVVMPQIDGEEAGTGYPTRRIRGTRRLLTTAAVIMSTYLITSSLATTLLIPQKEFESGGAANGRALAYLAHQYLGAGFGTFYDISTICILWFAGASAMAGLLNLVPRYLPRYGMAPQWARATRPLILVFTGIAVVVTLVFKADVDLQAGAYATGVLVLILSATIAVALSAKRHQQKKLTIAFTLIALVFTYTLIANIFERPDGVRIAAIFIAAILVVSIVSRVQRSFQLRAVSVDFDDQALIFITADADQFGRIRIVANEPDDRSAHDYRSKLHDGKRDSGIPRRGPLLFLEVDLDDSSNFEEDLHVHGHNRHGYRVLQVTSGNIPNTIASVLLAIRDETGVVPDVFFEWTEGNPLSNMFRFLITGTGEVAPVTREVLRRAEPRLVRRPDVHVK